ncbi:CRISPR-associated endonuclease Cas1 [Oleidesulfovibrio alaskensis]
MDKSEASAAILSDAEKDGVRTIPLRAISHVVVVGRPRITMPCVLALIERNIPVYFCKRTGDLLLAAHPAQGQWNMWAEQASAVQNTSVCLHLAQQTLSAKVHNQGIVLRRLGETRAIKEMFSLRDTIADTPCINSLRGIEGTAARLYWESVTQFLPEWVCFTGRKKRPSPDPVNALLSYGYTLLHNHISTKLQCAGLHPKLGFMHAGYGSHHAFASDMQEEFRHIVDSMVFSMFRRKEVRPEHLIWEKDALRPCLLRNSLLRTVTRNFEKRILTLQGSEQSCAAVVLDRQVGCCKQTLLRGVPYVGWRLLK